MTKARFKFWRQTAAEWAAENPVLMNDEPGFEEDTGKWKFGNGFLAWNDLPYSMPTALGGSGISEVEFEAHIDSELPHPTYDDGTSFELRYLNAKV